MDTVKFVVAWIMGVVFYNLMEDEIMKVNWFVLWIIIFAASLVVNGSIIVFFWMDY